MPILWEALPARDGRTTYLFTYMDAHPDRLGLEALFEDHLRLMPEYRAEITQLQLKGHCLIFFPRTGKVHCDHHGAAFASRR